MQIGRMNSIQFFPEGLTSHICYENIYQQAKKILIAKNGGNVTPLHPLLQHAPAAKSDLYVLVFHFETIMPQQILGKPV